MASASACARACLCATYPAPARGVGLKTPSLPTLRGLSRGPHYLAALGMSLPSCARYVGGTKTIASVPTAVGDFTPADPTNPTDFQAAIRGARSHPPAPSRHSSTLDPRWCLAVPGRLHRPYYSARTQRVASSLQLQLHLPHAAACIHTNSAQNQRGRPAAPLQNEAKRHLNANIMA